MKILHIRSSNFYGGPERQIHFHCLESLNSEFNITACSFSENHMTPAFLDVISRDNIQTHTFMVNSSYDLKSIGLIRTFLNENNIDVICTHDYRSHFYGGLARKNTNIRWVAFSRGWTRDNMKIRLYTWFDKFIIRFADQIVAVSHSQKKRLEKILVNTRNIHVIHNAVEPSAFDKISRINLREQFELEDGSIIGITGGRFSAEKGQRDLVKAAQIAMRENDKLRFILFGDGPDLNQIKRAIEKEHLSNRIICPGFEKNLIGCLKGADFLVNPSLSEGLPNIILEAMAMRIPCVATDVGGVGEIIEDNVNGLLVPPKSPEKLAGAIIRIADKGRLSLEMIDNAYQTIIDKFSFGSQFEKLTTLYTSLLRS